MRYDFFKIYTRWIVLLAILILGAACSSPSNTPLDSPSGTIIKVEPASSSAGIADTVSISIKIENVANLTAFEAHLSFDPATLEVVELTNGGFVSADFVVQNIFDNSTGTIDYAIAQINRSPANGSGTLFTIIFRAKASGDAPIHFRSIESAPAGVLLSDSNGIAIPVSLIEGSVTVK